jgi:hypothetical protein
MNEYTYYYRFGGKSRKATVTANSEAEARPLMEKELYRQTSLIWFIDEFDRIEELEEA